ncbi:MAG: hypothetical protein R3A79_13815 [Nannocystaceae bacterium]
MPRRKLTPANRLTRTSQLLERTDIAVYSPKERPQPARPKLTPKQRQLFAQPAPRRLDRAALTKAVATLSPALRERLKDVNAWDDGKEVVLSARTPLVDGRGHLDAWGVLSFHPTGPSFHFDYSTTKKEAIGGVEIWLDGLESDGIYLVEISLAVIGGTIRVGASDAPHLLSPAQGLDHKILVTILDPTYDISLITLEPYSGSGVQAWTFYEARIRRIN